MTTYFRYTNQESAINEMTGFGMFSANESRVAGCYGETRYTYDGTNGKNIEDLHDAIVEAYEDCETCLPEEFWDMDPEDFYKLFNPEDLVEDAQAWDDPSLRMFFNDFVYDDEAAVILDDGAIVYDETLVK